MQFLLLRSAVLCRVPTDLPDQFSQIHVKCGSKGVDHDNAWVADAAFQVIDHRAAHSGKSRQLALGNPGLLTDFHEGGDEGA